MSDYDDMKVNLRANARDWKRQPWNWIDTACLAAFLLAVVGAATIAGFIMERTWRFFHG